MSLDFAEGSIQESPVLSGADLAGQSRGSRDVRSRQRVVPVDGCGAGERLVCKGGVERSHLTVLGVFASPVAPLSQLGSSRFFTASSSMKK